MRGLILFAINPLLCMLLLCIVMPLYAQTDAAKYQDTAQIIRMISVADKMLNPDSAITLYNEIIAKSTAINYADGALVAIMTKGIKYYEKQDYEQCRNCCKAALPWAAKSTHADGVAWCYNGIGDAYFNEGDYLQASEYFYIALHEVEHAGPTHTAANIYNNLGHVHMRMKQYDKALVCYNKAEQIAKAGGLEYQLANAYTNMGAYYTMIHRADSAIVYHNMVMDIGRHMGKVDLQAEANADLGKAYIEKGDNVQAVIYLRRAIEMARNKFYYIVVDASYSLGDAWCRMARYKEAEQILRAGLQEAITHNIKDNYINCYTKLTAVYKATGRYDMAVGCMDTIAAWKDSLTSVEKAHAINSLEVKYMSAEKDKEIAEGQLLIAKQQSKITRKNIWVWGTAGSVALLSIVLVGIYRNARSRQRLDEEQIRALQQENKIDTLRAAVQGEEKERSRIAGELHDGIGGMLSAAMMRFRTIRHEQPQVTTVTAYKEAMDLLEKMGDEIRKTAHNLMPEVLLKQPLPDALRSFCSYMKQEGALQIDFQHYGNYDDITQEFRLSIYRIVQELLKNITTHAEATHALVQLVKQEHVLAITVEDNGKGFDTANVQYGMGLHNLATRVRSLNGSYTIESEVGKGTTVYIEFEI